MNSKEKRVQMLDPNRMKIAKNNAYVPGGPMNNNPMNVTSNNPTPGSMSGVNEYPYGDSGLPVADGRMGSPVMPQPKSELPQNTPLGTGYNGGQPFNSQFQPPAKFEEMLEGGRLSGDAKMRQLVSNQYMGVIGQPATVAPGGVVPSDQQSGATIPLGMNVLEGLPTAGGMNMKSGKRG